MPARRIEDLREYQVDLVIDKTFSVFAETPHEAKEKAVLAAREYFGTYNSLTIDFIAEVIDGELYSI